VRPVVNCKMCESVTALYLLVVTSCVYKCSINLIINSYPVYSHTLTRGNIYSDIQAVQLWWFLFIISYHLIFKLLFISWKYLEDSLSFGLTFIINFQIEWFWNMFAYPTRFIPHNILKRFIYTIYHNLFSSPRLTVEINFNFTFSSYLHFNFILHYTK
jgi:hypothetical protein